MYRKKKEKKYNINHTLKIRKKNWTKMAVLYWYFMLQHYLNVTKYISGIKVVKSIQINISVTYKVSHCRNTLAIAGWTNFDKVEFCKVNVEIYWLAYFMTTNTWCGILNVLTAFKYAFSILFSQYLVVIIIMTFEN